MPAPFQQCCKVTFALCSPASLGFEWAKAQWHPSPSPSSSPSSFPGSLITPNGPPSSPCPVFPASPASPTLLLLLLHPRVCLIHQLDLPVLPFTGLNKFILDSKIFSKMCQHWGVSKSGLLVPHSEIVSLPFTAGVWRSNLKLKPKVKDLNFPPSLRVSPGRGRRWRNYNKISIELPN